MTMTDSGSQEIEAETEAERVYLRIRAVMGDPAKRRSRRRVKRSQAGSRPYEKGREPFGAGDALASLTETMGWQAPMAASDVLRAWDELVGPEVAKHAKAVAIDSGLLEVQCDQTAWATQLRLMRTDLVTKIQRAYPDAGVENIRFVNPHAPSWRRGVRSVPGRGPRDTYG